MRWEKDIFIVSSYLPPRYLLITKGKMVALQWINLVGALSKQSSYYQEWDVPASRASWCDALRRIQHPFCDVQPKMHNLSLILENTRHIQLEEHSTKQLATALRKCCDHERRRLSELSQNGGDKRDTTAQCDVWAWVDPGAEEEPQRDSWQSWKKVWR